jgi:hypothetical protein
MNKLFDINHIKSFSKNHDLDCTLKRTSKGVSIIAKKPIKKGKIVAYYKILLFDINTHKGVKNSTYTISIYNKNGSENNNLIGDLYLGSLESPKYNIPFWGYLSNEPSPPKQTENVFLDINLKQNYKNKKKLKVGDTMIYKLIATRDIKIGEEICWCYGDNYARKYKVNCQ